MTTESFGKKMKYLKAIKILAQKLKQTILLNK